MKASCLGRYVLHFTCMDTKWSWCKTVAKKIDLVGAFNEFQIWVTFAKGSVTLVQIDSESAYVYVAFAKYCYDRGIRVSSSAP